MLRSSLKIHSTLRDRLPGDGTVESWLTVLVARQLDGRRQLGLGLVVVRQRTVELIDVSEARRAGFAPAMLLAGLTTTHTDGGSVEAVGLCGQVRAHGRELAVPVAMVFLEWADCRWWSWEALLAADGLSLREDTARERTAAEGDAMPAGLGRWWSHARRTGMQLQLTLEAPLVH